VDPLALLLAYTAAFALASLSAIAGFGGGALLLPVFTALFGLRVAVPMLTLTQLSSNGARAWINRRELHWRLVAWFALGAIPFAVAGGLLLGHAPMAPLKRLLGLFLIAVVVWRRLRPSPRPPSDPAFAAVGAASGLGSALLGSVGPLTGPFFLAYGLTRAAYIGTEATSALLMHLTKIVTYGGTNLISRQTLLLAVALTPATLLGTWTGKQVLRHTTDRLFIALVELALLTAGTMFLAGL
jgi:uncharacterized membrane protein YfcA